MSKKIFLIGLLISVVGHFVNANPTRSFDLQTLNLLTNNPSQTALNWKVGDQNDYSVDMGFIKGKMIMLVKSIDTEGLWIEQNIDLGFAGKQQVLILLDPNTGEIKKMIVNGQEQAPPKNDMEIIEAKEEKITVPAGTFNSIHVRLKDVGSQSEVNTWINPEVIPLSGMIKSIQPGQFGNVTILLTAYKKN